jgi:hypothetical protein
VVTSYSTSAAKVMRREDGMPSEERYKAAHEYMDLAYQPVFRSLLPRTLRLTKTDFICS